MTMIGGYTLHLYCDGGDHELRARAARGTARQHGWTISKHRQCCPLCADKRARRMGRGEWD